MCAGPFKPPKPPKLTPPPPPPPLPPVEPEPEPLQEDLRRAHGRASTLFTSPLGLTGSRADIATRALTG